MGSRARTSESKQNKRKIFEILQFLWKIVFLTDTLQNFFNQNQRASKNRFEKKNTKSDP